MAREITTPKFHVSDDGITRPCPAKTENGCRLQHFGSENEADQWKKEHWGDGTEGHKKSIPSINGIDEALIGKKVKFLLNGVETEGKVIEDDDGGDGLDWATYKDTYFAPEEEIDFKVGLIKTADGQLHEHVTITQVKDKDGWDTLENHKVKKAKSKRTPARVAKTVQLSGQEYRQSLLPKTKSLNVEIQDEGINYEGVPYTSFDVSRTTRKGVEKRLLNVTVYQPRDESERPVVLIKGSTDDDELLASEKKAQEAYVNKLKGNANLGRLSDPKFLNPIKEVKREFTVTDPDELTRNLETLENNGYFNRFDLSYDTIRNEIGEHWMTNPRGEEMKIYTGRDYATGGMKYRFYNQRNISSTFMKEFYSKPVDGQEWEIV